SRQRRRRVDRPHVPAVRPAPPQCPAHRGPGDLARLLDVNDDLREGTLLDQLAAGDGTDDERAEWAAAVQRFNELADTGAEKAAHKRFLPKLAKHPDPVKLVRRRLGQLKDDQAQRAATLRALWHELDRRAANRLPGMREGRRFHFNGESVTWAMTDMRLPTLEPAQFDAINAYTGVSYRLINDGLRGWQDPPPGKEKRFADLVRDCDAAFAKCAAPEPVLVHRGVGRSVLSSLGAVYDDSVSMQELVGKVFVEQGYISTSIGRRAAFTGEVYFMFRVPQGYEAMNAMHLSRFGTSEREILIRRNARYVVHAAYKHDSAWYIEAEIVPDDWTPGSDWTPDPYGDAWKGYQ
ncbi:MAG: ADP-ribosyltransferase, partial [Umezawaea sp.]